MVNWITDKLKWRTKGADYKVHPFLEVNSWSINLNAFSPTEGNISRIYQKGSNRSEENTLLTTGREDPITDWLCRSVSPHAVFSVTLDGIPGSRAWLVMGKLVPNCEHFSSIFMYHLFLTVSAETEICQTHWSLASHVYCSV